MYDKNPPENGGFVSNLSFNIIVKIILILFLSSSINNFGNYSKNFSFYLCLSETAHIH